jgi:hypothetical protein
MMIIVPGSRTRLNVISRASSRMRVLKKKRLRYLSVMNFEDQFTPGAKNICDLLEDMLWMYEYSQIWVWTLILRTCILYLFSLRSLTWRMFFWTCLMASPMKCLHLFWIAVPVLLSMIFIRSLMIAIFIITVLAIFKKTPYSLKESLVIFLKGNISWLMKF